MLIMLMGGYLTELLCLFDETVDYFDAGKTVVDQRFPVFTLGV